MGNICRSPMAEAVFRHKVKEAGLDGSIQADSAGTGDWHVGKPPHQGTRQILKQYRIDDSGIRARQVRGMILTSFNTSSQWMPATGPTWPSSHRMLPAPK
ncbi:hypothetical protein LJK88_46675 [Paenibacillus sp. P26]|nr:hypothetical protein LJK88_46675 [Paenibacillus sp. P26]